MRILEFNFKREAVWMIVLSLAPIVIGITVYLFLWLIRQFAIRNSQSDIRNSSYVHGNH
jgi:hypothetical protein